MPVVALQRGLNGQRRPEQGHAEERVGARVEREGRGRDAIVAQAGGDAHHSHPPGAQAQGIGGTVERDPQPPGAGLDRSRQRERAAHRQRAHAEGRQQRRVPHRHLPVEVDGGHGGERGHGDVGGGATPVAGERLHAGLHAGREGGVGRLPGRDLQRARHVGIEPGSVRHEPPGTAGVAVEREREWPRIDLLIAPPDHRLR